MKRTPSVDRSDTLGPPDNAEQRSTRRSLPAAAPARSSSGVVARYLRLVEPVLRSGMVMILAIAVFGVAGAVDGRAGLALASAFVLFHATYCLLNFWDCREAHCLVTGVGWTSLALVGFVAALTPGEALSWYRTELETAGYLVVLGLGYAFEWIVAARTGRRSLQ